MGASPYFDHPRPFQLGAEGFSRWDHFSCLCWSPDGHFVASCGSNYHDSTVSLWDINGTLLTTTHTGKKYDLTTCAWSPDSQTVAYATRSGTIYLWNPHNNGIIFTFTGHSAPVSGIAWCADGHFILSSGDDYTLIWNVQTGAILHQLQSASGNHRLVTALHPAGEHIALGAVGEPLRISNLGTSKIETNIVEHLDWQPIMQWSPSGNALLYTSGERILRVWTSQTKKKSAFFPTERCVFAVAWSPDGELFAAVTRPDPQSWPEVSDLFIWKRATIETVYHRVFHRSNLEFVDFSPDGNQLAVAGSDGLVQLWDLDGTHFPILWADDPPPARREELKFWEELNTEMGRPPYYEVTISSRQEVEWIMKEHDWFSRWVEKGGTSPHPDAAQFCGADLRGVDLSGLSFNTSDFSDADLRGANLTSCEFRGADLAHVQFEGAILHETDFSYASGLRYATLAGTDLRTAHLSETWVEGSNMTGCQFQGTKCSSTVFWNCDFTNADFTGAILCAEFSDCVFTGANFTNVDISFAKIRNCRVDHPNVFQYAKRNDSTEISDLF